MQTVGQVINLSQNKQTQPCNESSNRFSHEESVWVKVWRGLQSSKLISMDWKAGENDYQYWRSRCKDLTDQQLVNGLKDSAGFSGYFTLSEFLKLCKDSTRGKTQLLQHSKLKTGKAPDAIRAKLREMVEQSKSWSQTHTRVKP